MTDAIHFSPTSSGEHAMLGAIHIGTVQLMDSAKPDGRAQWISFLPDETGGWRPTIWKEVRSVAQARAVLTRHVAAWMNAAGLVKRAEEEASS